MGQENIKERLLNGKRQRETVETSVGPVEIRPLTNAEKGKVESLSVKGINVKTRGGKLDTMDIDLERTFASDHESNMVILSCGLSVDKNVRYSVKEIKESTMDEDDQAKLLEAIKDLSGITEGIAGIASAFRKNVGRKRDSDADIDGEHEAGGDAGGLDTPST